jgi:predicted N-acyltransferase
MSQPKSRRCSNSRDEADLTARLAGPASIGAEAWNACANPEGIADPHPFTRFEFFAAVEESGSAAPHAGWRPVISWSSAAAHRGLMPLYLKNHSQGEYVFDHGWADAFERAGGSYYPKLQASVPFTPVTGRAS